MNDALIASLISAGIGAAVAIMIAPLRMDPPPQGLLRTNYRGRVLPVVLGEAVVMGGLMAIAALTLAAAVGWEAAPSYRMAGALALIVTVMGAAGSWDDHRGDERPRGFKGHLSSIGSRRLTGGLVKLVAGGVVGVAAGAILSDGHPASTIEVGLLVALTANLINLFDRAPGRSAKVSLALGIVLIFGAADGWIVGAAGLLAALASVTRLDLSERAMLGDAGANPVGAVLGLGLATALSQPGRWVAIAILLGINLASERWSFSEAIDRTPSLRRLDHWGRQP